VKKELSIAEEGVGALPIEEEEGGAADLGTMPPLYSYSPSSGGFSGYSD
jgi:lipid-binding SYLF domain-containing protein